MALPWYSHVVFPVLVAALTSFSAGLQCIPLLTFFQLPTALFYSRHGSRAWLSILLTWLAIGAGSTVAYLGVFNVDGEFTTEGSLAAAGIAFVMSLIYMIAFLFDRVFSKKFPNAPIASSMVFPLLFTGLSTLIFAVSPLGTWSAYAYSMLDFAEGILASTSLAGLAAVHVFICFHASASVHFVETFIGMRGEPSKELPGVGPAITEKVELESLVPKEMPAQTMRSKIRASLRNPVTVYILFSLALALYGSFFVPFTNYFFQQSITKSAPQLLPVGCMIGLDSSAESYFDRTASLARAGARIVLWSENAAILRGDRAETEFWATGGAKAKEIGSYIGATYLIVDSESADGKQRNMFVLFSPHATNTSATPAIVYQKAYPVPFVEGDVQPGDGIMQVADTEHGRIGAAICFDYDNARFIRQASTKGVDIMLQPSENWGPIGYLHAGMASVRAVENGNTLFRCSSLGVSGLYDNLRESRWRSETLEKGDYLAYLPKVGRTPTLYGLWGDAPGWLSLAVGVLLAVVSVLPSKWVRKLTVCRA